MNIYLLKRKNTITYDEFIGKVVVADSSVEARILANVNTADEGKIWEDSKKVSCEVINLSFPGVVLESFNAG